MDGLVRNRAARRWQLSSQGTNGLCLGMLNAARGWLAEDTPALGVSYLHFGSARTIYSVPAKHRTSVDEILAEMCHDKAQSTPGQPVTRTHAMLLDPAVLMKRDVPISAVTQEPGEFVLHFSGSYHSVFCHGYTCWEYATFTVSPPYQDQQQNNRSLPTWAPTSSHVRFSPLQSFCA